MTFKLLTVYELSLDQRSSFGLNFIFLHPVALAIEAGTECTKTMDKFRCRLYRVLKQFAL